MTSRERRGWTIVGGFFLAQFFIVGSAYDTAGVFFTPLLKHFGWSRTQLSMLTSAISLATAVVGPAIGWALDRFESKWMATLGAVLCAAAFVMASMAEGFAWMITAYLLLGIGAASSAIIPCYYVISNWFEERRGLAMTLAITGVEVGGAIMTVLASYVIVHAGWRTAYLVMAVPVLIVVVPVLLGVVRSHPPAAITPTDVTDPHEPHAQAGLETATALRERSFWLVAISYLAYACAATALIVHLVPYLIGVGMTQERAALALSLMLALNIIGKPALGALADRVGIRLVYGLNLLAIGVGFSFLLGAHSPAMVALFVLVCGLSVGAPIALMPMLLAYCVGLRRFGSLSGLLVTMGVIGSAVGPIVAGSVFDHTGSYVLIFELLTAFLLISAFFPIGCISYQDRDAAAALPQAAS